MRGHLDDQDHVFDPKPLTPSIPMPMEKPTKHPENPLLQRFLISFEGWVVSLSCRSYPVFQGSGFCRQGDSEILMGRGGLFSVCGYDSSLSSYGARYREDGTEALIIHPHNGIVR